MKNGPQIVKNGLLLTLDAADKLSYPGTGTVWRDISGNGNDGTLTNGPVFNDGNVGRISLDGVNDYISTNLILPSPVSTATTFDIVFKYNGTTSYRGLIGISGYQTSGFSYGFMGQSSMMATYMASGQSYEPATSYDSSVISHGIFVFNGRTITAYRNGSLLSTSTASFDAAANNGGIQIGRNLQGGWDVSQVDIYCVKVYNRALSASEIQQNFNALRGRFGI